MSDEDARRSIERIMARVAREIAAYHPMLATLKACLQVTRSLVENRDLYGIADTEVDNLRRRIEDTIRLAETGTL